MYFSSTLRILSLDCRQTVHAYFSINNSGSVTINCGLRQFLIFVNKREKEIIFFNKSTKILKFELNLSNQYWVSPHFALIGYKLMT